MGQLRILIVAGSSARRAELAHKAGKASKALITTSSDVVPDAQVDIVVLDAESPRAADSSQRLPAGTGVIVLVDNPDPLWVTQALRAGVNAILSREVTADELHLAFLAADAGLVLLHPSSALSLVPQTFHRDVPGFSGFVEPLTAREQEILRLMSEGLGNKAIARQLKISDHTVKFHISSILGKLSVNSRTEAVSLGIRKGIIPI